MEIFLILQAPTLLATAQQDLCINLANASTARYETQTSGFLHMIYQCSSWLSFTTLEPSLRTSEIALGVSILPHRAFVTS
jgi:hypothetical protein